MFDVCVIYSDSPVGSDCGGGQSWLQPPFRRLARFAHPACNRAWEGGCRIGWPTDYVLSASWLLCGNLDQSAIAGHTSDADHERIITGREERYSKVHLEYAH